MRPDETQATAYTAVVITLFPELFEPFFAVGVLGKAVASGRVAEHRIDPREFTPDVHRTVDDTPYGGGAGMVMKPEPLAAAIRRAREVAPAGAPCLLLCPQGRPLTQARVAELAQAPGVILVCGRYEGVDERVRRALVDESISLGDFVVSGGEVAAMAVIEALSRLVPGVLGNAESTEHESFAQGVLEYPQFTRPAEWEGRKVPQILRSGDHGRIREWRRAQALWRTRQSRPDLFAQLTLSERDIQLMATFPPTGEEPESP